MPPRRWWWWCRGSSPVTAIWRCNGVTVEAGPVENIFDPPPQPRPRPPSAHFPPLDLPLTYPTAHSGIVMATRTQVSRERTASDVESQRRRGEDERPVMPGRGGEGGQESPLKGRGWVPGEEGGEGGVEGWVEVEVEEGGMEEEGGG